MARFLRRRQAGQAMILFALACVTLFGLLVFALDGGLLYLDKRQIQNAADAGALAGAYRLESLPIPTYSPAHQVALQMIVDNLPGTTVPTPTPTGASFSRSLGAGYSVDVVVSGGGGWDTYKVTITHVHILSLGQALGFGNPSIQAMAKAQSSTYPFAMILLQNDAQIDNFTTSGNGRVTLIREAGATGAGGGHSNESWNVGSNGSVYFSPCGAAGDLWAANEISASATFIDARTFGAQAIGDTTCTAHPSSALPYPQVSAQIPFPNYPEPPATGPTYGAGAISAPPSLYLCPGTFSDLSISGGTAIFTPGVYRFTGTISPSGGGSIRTSNSADYSSTAPYTINAGAGTGYNCSSTPTQPADGDYGVIIEIAPSGCTTTPQQLYVTGNSSALIDIYPSPKYNKISLYIELFGGATWHTACPYIISPLTVAGTHVVDISGQGAYNIRGAIYGPADNMHIAGNGSGYGVGQLIAWTALAEGNGNLKENYDPAYLPYFRGLIQ